MILMNSLSFFMGLAASPALLPVRERKADLPSDSHIPPSRDEATGEVSPAGPPEWVSEK